MLVIPAKAGLRRQDAEANIRAANGPQGTRQEPRVIRFLLLARHSRESGNPVLSLAFAFFFCLNSKGFHSSCGGAGYFSCLPKRSNQEKGTPNVAPSRHPALRGAPAGYGVCSMYVRVHVANSRTS